MECGEYIKAQGNVWWDTAKNIRQRIKGLRKSGIKTVLTSIIILLILKERYDLYGVAGTIVSILNNVNDGEGRVSPRVPYVII